jgi:uncharacterized membrane protein
MSGHFKQGQFTEGLLHGIARAGELLAAHFPSRPIRQAQGKPGDKSPSADTVIED